MRSLDESLREKLSKRQQAGLMRKLTAHRLPFDFFSNDYLGLARSEELFRLIETLHRKTGIHNGSTGSRLLGGNSPFVQQTEKYLSGVFKSEASLIFNSGYTANLAVLSAIPQKGDTILYDSLAHASLKDGARLSLATRHSFRHNDISDLEQKLRAARGKKFIAVEAIYSMDGDECPLQDVVSLAARYDAAVILDEAHSTGVRGPGGAGCSVEQNLHDKVDVRVYTFGKGMGVHGACVAGSETLIRFLVNFARPFIYTTALSQHDVAAISCAFDLLSNNMMLQETLRSKVNVYLQGAREINNRTPSRSAIQTILVPGNDKVRNAAASLQQKGFDVRPILFPTVPEGTERLRICLHTFNSDEEIVSLTNALGSLA
jgi:8-amino-7-oxononanoate synthase